ncbi:MULTISPECIES: hypothetical protein [Streptomyces]|uniref:hypothetical protein n=1 Tax=Streptomyces TaxID=1883 RepID=UPI002FF2F737
MDVPQLARNDSGGVRADAEIVLNEAGRAVLAKVCRVQPAVLARALPVYTTSTTNPGTGAFQRASVTV